MKRCEANLIRQLKKRCTYRALAEIYYDSDDIRYGNQLYGSDLCVLAFQTLYPGKHPYDYIYGKDKRRTKFDRENKSFIGDFYWWE